MTLSFQQFFDKEKTKKTHFVEKIWQSFPFDASSKEIQEWFGDGKVQKHYDFSDDAISMRPKIHTIREDKKNLWKADNKIHFVINNRTPKRFQFAPVMPCIRVQKIEIKLEGLPLPSVYIDNQLFFYFHGNKWDEMKDLAYNDGFDSVEDFFKWFDKPFVGKIIHWTNEAY